MSEHRPEPFTTVQGLHDLGIQGDLGNDGWYQVAQTKRSIVAALAFLKDKGCERISMLLNVIAAGESGDYCPVSVYAEPEALSRAYAELDFSKVERKPTLYFKLDTYSGKPGAFVSN